MDRFTKVDDYLSADSWVALLHFFEQNVRWAYGWQSNPTGKTPLAHLNHDFLKVNRDNQENASATLAADASLTILNQLWLKLQADYLHGHSLVRCYANAHVYGIEGDVHTDSLHPGNYTTIFYIVPQWDVEWAGETVLINDSGDIAQSVIPRPNRIMIFDGRIRHAARAVHRKFSGLRVTLMFKSREEGAQGDN
jgi:Rps23 Pro-64 3,4-dihydroxylase Tpa1-like proline 4-hydroxylase